ncbi:bifunctional orotidine-5'-phosphate decarboxylase/orotate phosphoribosyltransferase [Spirulina sp. 06S082]|uniref:bifunctional orotidine-5'-phosphate decarboxylase/orotate phosphoribosyltransferase n=1 Tax=Spirulina sp. 06S082 TaxID=3110248 RepID=UPI002B1F0239|nr:bifunctional orotidine-5'-phosphate decarboxylase/orotate phosphoribosyltransferase [Spirulina sp. 06S082]MEA5468052.1 bifunctional orotidine-5'-phosphate decarboxylase/orotate phosphoribosyltransferase [Spirulina sp. 06S082]
MNFSTKLSLAIAQNQSILVLGLDPNPEMLPDRYGIPENKSQLITAFRDWLTGLIQETQSYICAYKLSFGFYKSYGASGLELLEVILAEIPQHLPVILDANHGDLNTTTVFARTAFHEWQVDAITLSPYAGQDQAAPFLLYPEKAAFILCRTSNPSAFPIQEYPDSDSPLYLQIVKEVKAWGTPEQLCLEVGTTSPDILAEVRSLAPERLIWLRSIWAQEENLEGLIRAGLNENGEGLLLPVPQDWGSQENIVTLLQSLNDRVGEICHEVRTEGTTCEVWVPDVCLLKQHPHQDLILQLFDIGCILFGDYVQASGATFSYYIDLRTIISRPQVFHQVLNAYEDVLKTLSFDRIAGIPYGSLPTATGLSLRLQHPMIFPRKETKAHGTRKAIEGKFVQGETVVVVDDILISGKSAIEGANKLQSAGLVVEDIVVLIDHEGGVKERLRESGYNAHSVLGISDITQTLYEAGRIDEQQYAILLG